MKPKSPQVTTLGQNNKGDDGTDARYGAQESLSAPKDNDRVRVRQLLTLKAMYFRSRNAGVKLHFIQPGKPTQNAFVESFNGKLRE